MSTHVAAAAIGLTSRGTLVRDECIVVSRMHVMRPSRGDSSREGSGCAKHRFEALHIFDNPHSLLLRARLERRTQSDAREQLFSEKRHMRRDAFPVLQVGRNQLPQ